ncbi:uncharacterized protein LOC128556774 [Mercenaria mercenaria]|uniref:uncharacterized protein LOC128556774 n=1 Tax=Mercenaria mercenaria TaxID=6596 RepID=UPI00234F7C94|nr:uncharacterized protein LOC128556774 [Mercenaria mercenaria]
MLEKYSFYSLLLLHVISSCDVLTTVSCTIQTAQFKGESSLNDKICIESERIVHLSARSKIFCSQMCDESSACTGVFYNAATRSCTACRGYVNVEEQIGTVFFTKIGNLEGKLFMIYVKANNEYWHFDVKHPTLKAVTSIFQPSDDFVKFIFEKQVDGSYKIKSVASPIYIYDGYGVVDAHAPVLNGNDNTDDAHMRYVVSSDGKGCYRIQTKATGRYVRLDADQYVSSKLNLIDDRSLFELVDV